jgi:hypothetical protein
MRRVFRQYRGHGADFVPGEGNLIATLNTCSYADELGRPARHELCAVDIHGNASPYAGILPNGAVDVPGSGLPRELTFSPPSPPRAGAAPSPGPTRAACTPGPERL